MGYYDVAVHAERERQPEICREDQHDDAALPDLRALKRGEYQLHVERQYYAYRGGDHADRREYDSEHAVELFLVFKSAGGSVFCRIDDDPVSETEVHYAHVVDHGSRQIVQPVFRRAEGPLYYREIYEDDQRVYRDIHIGEQCAGASFAPHFVPFSPTIRANSSPASSALARYPGITLSYEARIFSSLETIFPKNVSASDDSASRLCTGIT